MSIVYATTDAFVGHSGIPVRIQVGEVWDSADEIVREHPQFFTAAAPTEGRAKRRTKEDGRG